MKINKIIRGYCSSTDYYCTNVLNDDFIITDCEDFIREVITFYEESEEDFYRIEQAFDEFPLYEVNAYYPFEQYLNFLLECEEMDNETYKKQERSEKVKLYNQLLKKIKQL